MKTTDESGQALAEYGLLLVLIAVGFITTLIITGVGIRYGGFDWIGELL